jgi:hypothetical protein
MGRSAATSVAIQAPPLSGGVGWWRHRKPVDTQKRHTDTFAPAFRLLRGKAPGDHHADARMDLVPRLPADWDREVKGAAAPERALGVSGRGWS